MDEPPYEPRNHKEYMKYVVLLVFTAALLAGCGKKEESLANRAGESLGRHITDFTKGVGKGIDQKMTVDVTVRPEVLALGLTNTIGKSLGLDAKRKGISVYFVASQNVSNNLIARALNAEGVEIGRCKKPVVIEKDAAAYVNFEFEDEMDSAMVKRYVIGL
jgi:hypothetical protein